MAYQHFYIVVTFTWEACRPLNIEGTCYQIQGARIAERFRSAAMPRGFTIAL